MPIKLNTASGGGVILTGANTASDKTITVPAVDGTMNMSGAANEVPAGSASTPAIYPTGDTNTGIFFPAADTVAITTGGAERYRIGSSDFLVNRTTGLGAARFVVEQDTTTANPMAISNPRSTAATDYAILFYRNGSIVGSVQTSLSATSYVTSSDYRLKENVRPMTGALAKVEALKPCTYTWKADGEAGQGFIAHELAEVVPDAVTGEKDAVNEDGSIKPQGIDTSFLVATLTAAIQEQQQMIETLQAKVATLEAK